MNSSLKYLPVALLIFISSPSQAAEAGFYVGLEAGIAASNDLDLLFSGINHPTRCDRLLYRNPNDAPSDSACLDNASRPLVVSGFELDAGFAGGVNLGYRFGRWRLEGEYLHRSHGDDHGLINLGSAGNAALGTKDSEWDVQDPPSQGVSGFRAQHFFLNVFYDFPGDTNWTPYLGVGVGVGDFRMRYYNRFLRRSDLGELGPEEWRDAAAGTISYLDTEVESSESGFQAIGGMDYALGERTSIGVKVRWTRFQGFTDKDQGWNRIRSHAPVTADGTTPYQTDMEADDMEHWTWSAGIKYQF